MANGWGPNRETVQTVVYIAVILVVMQVWTLDRTRTYITEHIDAGEHPSVRILYETKEAALLKHGHIIARLDRIERLMEDVRKKQLEEK